MSQESIIVYRSKVERDLDEAFYAAAPFLLLVVVVGALFLLVRHEIGVRRRARAVRDRARGWAERSKRNPFADPYYEQHEENDPFRSPYD